MAERTCIKCKAARSVNLCCQRAPRAHRVYSDLDDDAEGAVRNHAGAGSPEQGGGGMQAQHASTVWRGVQSVQRTAIVLATVMSHRATKRCWYPPGTLPCHRCRGNSVYHSGSSPGLAGLQNTTWSILQASSGSPEGQRVFCCSELQGSKIAEHCSCVLQPYGPEHCHDSVPLKALCSPGAAGH